MAVSSSACLPVAACAPCWKEVVDDHNDDDGDGDDDDDDDDENELDVPYSASLSASLADAPPAVAPPTATDAIVEVRLWRDGQEALGLVLDATNHIVALRHGSPAAAAFDEGRLHVGDQILSVCGVGCSEQQRVGEVLRALGPKKVYELRLHRYAQPPAHLPTGATLRAGLERQQAEQREQWEQWGADGEPGEAAAGAAGAGRGGGRHTSIEAAAAQVEAEGAEADAATRARLWPMWRRQARQPLERRLSAADMLRQEGNAKFSRADFAGALKE